MGVYEIIDVALESLGLPYFEGMPDFGDDEPESYYTYTADVVPAQSADDIVLNEEYNVYINMLTPALDAVRTRNTTAAFEEAGFIWQGTWTLPPAQIFPFKRQTAFEFKIAFERS